MEGLDSECEMSGAEEDARSPSSCSLSSNKCSTDDKTITNNNISVSTANCLPNGSLPMNQIYGSLSPKPDNSELQQDLNPAVRGKPAIHAR